MVHDDARRRLLISVGGLAAVGVSGCLDSEGYPDEEAADRATNTPADGEGGDGGREGNHEHAEGSEHGLGEPRSEVEVEMLSDDGHHFRPHAVHIERGGTVTWSVETGEHDTRAYHPDTHGEQQRIPDGTDPWSSDLLHAESEPFERTFDSAGVYDFACSPHEATGMVGTVVVGWPDPDGQPGLESPSDGRPDATVEQLEGLNEQVRTVLEEHGDADAGDGDDGGHHDEPQDGDGGDHDSEDDHGSDDDHDDGHSEH